MFSGGSCCSNTQACCFVCRVNDAMFSGGSCCSNTLVVLSVASTMPCFRAGPAALMLIVLSRKRRDCRSGPRSYSTPARQLQIKAARQNDKIGTSASSQCDRSAGPPRPPGRIPPRGAARIFRGSRRSRSARIDQRVVEEHRRSNGADLCEGVVFPRSAGRGQRAAAAPPRPRSRE